MFKLNVFDKPYVCQTQFGLKEKIEYGVGGKAISDKVYVGDNLAIQCENDNGEVFWLLLYDKPKHIVKDTFTDPHKNTYCKGDEVIRGHQYDLLQPRSLTYCNQTKSAKSKLDDI